MGRRVVLLAVQSIASISVATLLLSLWHAPGAAPVAGLLFVAGLISAIAAIASAAERRDLSQKA